MKKSFAMAMLITLAFALMSSTCSSDDDGNSNNNAAEIEAVVNTAESGTWSITYFFDTDEETNNFTGYQFTFNADGTLTATDNTTTVNGVWSVTDDSNSSSRSTSDDIDFNISFTSPPNFEELSDDWDIISVSSTKIELIDVSGGNGGTDYLTFEKL